MRLLGWPRRSLFTTKVAVGVTTGDNANSPIILTSIASSMGLFATVTPTATFAPVARQHTDYQITWGVAPGSILLRLQRALPARGYLWKSLKMWEPPLACRKTSLARRERFLHFYSFTFLPFKGSAAITKQTLKNTVVMTNLHNKSAKVRAI